MLTREDVEKMPWFGESRAQVMELIETVERFNLLSDDYERELKRSIARLLQTLDYYESGDFEAVCACSSSGNEEPPGSIDIVCAMCTARKFLGITKKQDTAEVMR